MTIDEIQHYIRDDLVDCRERLRQAKENRDGADEYTYWREHIAHREWTLKYIESVTARHNTAAETERPRPAGAAPQSGNVYQSPAQEDSER